MRRGLQVVFPNVEGVVRRDHDRDIWEGWVQGEEGLKKEVPWLCRGWNLGSGEGKGVMGIFWESGEIKGDGDK